MYKNFKYELKKLYNQRKNQENRGITNEQKFDIILTISAFFHDTVNQYFNTIDSTKITNNSHTHIDHIYRDESSNKKRISHNTGRVIVVGKIQNNKSLLLRIFSSFQNIFDIINKIRDSIKIANNHISGNCFVQ